MQDFADGSVCRPGSTSDSLPILSVQRVNLAAVDR